MSDEPDIETGPENIEPSDAEIAAAAEVEAREAATRARAARKTTTPRKRGPGRPPGARNKPKGETDARASGKTTKTTPTRPKTPAITTGGGDSGPDDADRAARRAQREARARRVTELTAQVKEHKTGFVMGVGTLGGLPVEYLVQPQMGGNGQPIIDAETQQPIPELTVYGAQLAPKDWQIRTCVEAYVRIEETDIGERFADAFDKWAPYLLMAGGVGAIGMYTWSTLQISAALKPMIAEEIRARAQAEQQQQAPADQPAG